MEQTNKKLLDRVRDAKRLSVAPRSLPSPSGRGAGGGSTIRRHHLHESGLQKAIRAAAQAAGIPKRVSPHTFRHSFATHLLEAHYDIRTVCKGVWPNAPSGHKDVKTTMLYTHACTERSERILQRGGLAVRSPLDG